MDLEFVKACLAGFGVLRVPEIVVREFDPDLGVERASFDGREEFGLRFRLFLSCEVHCLDEARAAGLGVFPDQTVEVLDRHLPEDFRAEHLNRR